MSKKVNVPEGARSSLVDGRLAEQSGRGCAPGTRGSPPPAPGEVRVRPSRRPAMLEWRDMDALEPKTLRRPQLLTHVERSDQYAASRPDAGREDKCYAGARYAASGWEGFRLASGAGVSLRVRRTMVTVGQREHVVKRVQKVVP
jgi:hypothetical protein